MQDIFFYGLFMDPSLLQSKGLQPTIVGPAELADYELRIGAKASVLAKPGAACHGMLIALSDDEAAHLYADPGVAGYAPQTVEVRLHGSDALRRALCYILPADLLGEQPNTHYARQLADVALRLQLPASYVEEIRRFS